MNYIVDPSWVYWLDVSDTLKIVCIILGILGVVGAAIAIPLACIDAYDKEDYKGIMKWAVPLVFVAALSVLAGIFIPSKQTLIGMKVAELATKENVTLTAQQLKEIVDYIINALKELK